MEDTNIGSEAAVMLTHARSRYWKVGISGLTCAGEAASLERRLRRVGGVETVTVNPLTEQAYVAFVPDEFQPLTLISEIERAGYQAR